MLYELHVGTFTPEGTFAGVDGELEDLRDLGVTAIELMPLADFPGRRNWGYDGVLPFAPDAAYGTPGRSQAPGRRGARAGLMVFLDVVYNHFGPDGQLSAAPTRTQFFTERHQTPWGAAINFDGRQPARCATSSSHNALYWLEEFRFDGLRLDAVHAIMDDSADAHPRGDRERARAGSRAAMSISCWKTSATRRAGSSAPIATAAPAHAQWNDDSTTRCTCSLTGEGDGYYADYADRPVEQLGRCLAEGFAYQGEMSRASQAASRAASPRRHLPPTAFVGFLQNHDQVGNRALRRAPDGARRRPKRWRSPAPACCCCAADPAAVHGRGVGRADSRSCSSSISPTTGARAGGPRGPRARVRERSPRSPSSAARRSRTRRPEATFALSRLDRDEAARAPHRGAPRRDAARCSRLRQAEVAPACEERRSCGAQAQIAAAGRRSTSPGRSTAGRLRFAANFGDAEAASREGPTASLSASSVRARTPVASGCRPWTRRRAAGARPHERARRRCIDQLAALVGIAPGYTDIVGRRVETAAETRRALLRASASTSRPRRSAARQPQRTSSGMRRGPVPALVPVDAGQPARIPARPSPGSGEVDVAASPTRAAPCARRARSRRGGRRARALARRPSRPAITGSLLDGGTAARAEATVIAAPRALLARRTALREGARRWGVTAQVYGLRSARDFGIGGYADVAHAGRASRRPRRLVPRAQPGPRAVRAPTAPRSRPTRRRRGSSSSRSSSNRACVAGFPGQRAPRLLQDARSSKSASLRSARARSSTMPPSGR